MQLIKSLPVELKQLINSELAHHFGIIPKSSDEHTVTFYISEEKYTNQVQSELSTYIGKVVKLEKSPNNLVNAALFKYYRKLSLIHI